MKKYFIITFIITLLLLETGCSAFSELFNSSKTTISASVTDKNNNSEVLSVLNLTEKNMPVDNIFKAEKISENVVRIQGMAGEMMYLVEGNNKAALIDTGSGIGSLRKFVEKMTSKPITVILTHGHVDHSSGAPEFDEVYMNHADDEVYKAHNKLQMRKEFLTLVDPNLNKNFSDSDYVKEKLPTDYKELKDGMKFDLGGTTLTAYSLPGHTPGSMVILFEDKKLLLTGDSANKSTFLFDKYSLGLTTYENSIKNLLKKIDGKYNKIIYSHGSDILPKELLNNMVDLCEEIKLGKADDVPFEFMGDKGYLAKKVNNNQERIDGGVGNIIYSKEKVNQ